MVLHKICGFIDGNDPTTVKYANGWTDGIEAFNGNAADQIHDYDQGMKGKGLPGDPNVFYFIACDEQATTATYLVKAKYDPVADTISLSVKPLLEIQDEFETVIVAVPRPNQLTVTTGGRVFMPVGSYDTPYASGRAYYLDVTGTLSDDPDDWTITPRYSVITLGVGDVEVEGTFCMCLSLDETQIFFVPRIIFTPEETPLYLQVSQLCDPDGSNPTSGYLGLDLAQHRKAPLNVECCPAGNSQGHFVLWGYEGITANDFILYDAAPDNITVTPNDPGQSHDRTIAFDISGVAYSFITTNSCPGSPNPMHSWTSGGAGAWGGGAPIFSMVCPQATPTHHDVYLPTDEPWTASGIISEQDGSVRQGAPTTQDWEETPYYLYPCTAAPRTAVIPP